MSAHKSNHIIPIKPIGSYFDIDNEGYIINPTSLDKIDFLWTPMIQDVIEIYKKHNSPILKSVWVRGSVARGQAIPNLSDVDTFALIDIPTSEIKYAWMYDARKELIHKYPSTKVELAVYSLNPLSKEAKILINEAVCVWGEEVTIPRIKPGRDMMRNTPKFEERLQKLFNRLHGEYSPKHLQEECSWLTKQLLRIGLEITMERSQKYTRDLYLCYKTFSEYYPEKESEMREALFLALNPTSDKKIIQKVANNLGLWLLKESKKYI